METSRLISHFKHSQKAYSRLRLKALIRSCLFLLRRNLLEFLIVFLVKVLSRVSRERISCKTNSNCVHKYFAVVRTTSYTIMFRIIGYRTTQRSEFQNVIAWLVARKLRHNWDADQAAVGVAFCLFSFIFFSSSLEFLGTILQDLANSWISW